MDFDPVPFDLLSGLGHWLLVLLAVATVGLFTALIVSLLALGVRGPWFVLRQIGRGLVGFAGAFTPAGLQRVGAIAKLAIREAIRRKALWIFAIFALLFMFAGWFLGSATTGTSEAAKPFITFVLKVVQGLSLPLAVLLSCWGLPQDIKARSLHTVVTKPVPRIEIVLGRMAGYAAVTTLVVAVMAVIGYVWIARTVPERARSQLIGRVPVYGELGILDREGKPGEGVNVGDIWDYRRYIDGNSRARAIFTFDDLPVDELQAGGPLPVEYDFEVFRTYKGDIETGVQAQFTLVNDRGTPEADDDLELEFPDIPFEVKEFTDSVSEAVVEIPPRLIDREGYPVDLYRVATTSPPRTDAEGTPLDPDEAEPDGMLAPGQKLTIRVRCVDPEQYLGVARSDLFVRLPDRPFWLSYLKAMLGILLQTLVLVIIGTTASCIVKGPVATFLVGGVMILSIFGLREYAVEELLKRGETIADREAETILGGGPIESVYRLVTQLNQTGNLPDTPGFKFMKETDKLLLGGERLVVEVVPDFTAFETADYITNGFDVPWSSALLPAFATTLAFLIPCVFFGGLCLQMRELEAK